MMNNTDNNKSDSIIISIENVIPRISEFCFTAPVNWEIKENQQWAIIGPNGAGKTLLADLLQNKYALKQGNIHFGFEGRYSEKVKSIAFKDIYTLVDCRNSYYQQRWHATEVEEISTVNDLVCNYEDKAYLQEMFSFFGIEDLLPKKLIFLSSGELRKFLIVRSLLQKPRILILDNPFIGLDADSRTILKDLLERISHIKQTQIILLLSNPGDIPEMITHVLPVIDRTLLPVRTREEFLSDKTLIRQLFPSLGKDETIVLPVNRNKQPSDHQVSVRMENVSIRYGERTILENLNWEVKNGERWALSGPNGSGKSTLLSLLYADNPQSYANTFYLFDRKRGTGESIWDIKRRIGYVSPEMHLYYNQNVAAIQIVGSGFFDSIGLHRKCTADQEKVALQWMEVFGVDHLKERLFLTLSSGEQRLVLLARAFVKDPDLLILDEPLHGLDICRKEYVGKVIDTFCSRPGKTLIYVTHYANELPRSVNHSFQLEKRK